MQEIKLFLGFGIAFLTTICISSCSKFTDRHADIYHPVAMPSNPVSDTAPLCGNIKGTMVSGKTYTLGCDVTVQAGDTLLIESGVHINATNGSGILVNGILLSLGTKDKPNFMTVAGVTRTDQVGAPANTDPAYKGLWRGVIGGTGCTLIVLKWTHVDFGGAAAGALIGPAMGIASNKNTYSVYFQNPAGSLIIEDSWFYGSVDAPINVFGGKVAILRNTFEKCGFTSGEAFSTKGGTIGDFAYNLCVGVATNAAQISNSGGTTIQTNLRFYNNTIINCGWRRSQSGRGGSVNYEVGAAGKFYNNLIVNCKVGPRVVVSPPADTLNLEYGYNFKYGDSSLVTNQFYPVSYITKPQPTDIPIPATFLPANYTLGDKYDGTSLIGQNNPLFINAPVPLPAGFNLRDVCVVGNYNFALKPNSPCIGIGYTGFVPTGNIPIDPVYGITELLQPGKDIGAYQINGAGNHH
ncbi:hypothetical protein [Chitinophaga sp. 212800010-3]|uniref:hypothetical protein n=1 Tax=unclassified Chitinophaga TaxID=2619133 RepID=UPI002E118071